MRGFVSRGLWGGTCAGGAQSGPKWHRSGNNDRPDLPADVRGLISAAGSMTGIQFDAAVQDWTGAGAGAIDPASRGTHVDARHSGQPSRTESWWRMAA